MKKKPATKPALNLILLGDPGAGKATQAGLLSKKYSFFDYDMGRELTLLREKNKAVDKAQKLTADQGILTPTKIVRALNRTVITKTPKNTGIVFDGHPKMLGEAKLVAGLLKKSKRPDPLVIYIKIPQNEVVTRITHRKGYFNTKFSKRSDDSIQALKNRAKYYRTNIKQVTDYFNKVYKFVYIDGVGTRQEIHKKIDKVIKEHIKNS